MQYRAGIEVVIEASWRERIKRRYVTAATTKSTTSRPSKIVSIISSRALTVKLLAQREDFVVAAFCFLPSASCANLRNLRISVLRLWAPAHAVPSVFSVVNHHTSPAACMAARISSAPS